MWDEEGRNNMTPEIDYEEHLQDIWSRRREHKYYHANGDGMFLDAMGEKFAYNFKISKCKEPVYEHSRTREYVPIVKELMSDYFDPKRIGYTKIVSRLQEYEADEAGIYCIFGKLSCSVPLWSARWKNNRESGDLKRVNLTVYFCDFHARYMVKRSIEKENAKTEALEQTEREQRRLVRGEEKRSSKSRSRGKSRSKSERSRSKSKRSRNESDRRRRNPRDH